MFRFIQNDRQYYADIYHALKYNGEPLPKMSPFERMEYSYYNMQLASGKDFPMNAIVMNEEWYITCFIENGNKPMFLWNELKIFMDREMIFPFAFLCRNE